jgi:hypothetical protein
MKGAQAAMAGAIKDSFTINFYPSGMRFIALFAAITALSAGAARAMPLAAPSPHGADARLLERVTNICGISGCAPVWTKRIRKPLPGFVKHAVPLTVIPASQQQNTAPIK